MSKKWGTENMNKIKPPEYFCTTCFLCGKPAEFFHGKLQGIICYKSGYKKPILINAGFCKHHALSTFDSTGETVLGSYNREKMGPVVRKEKLQETIDAAMIEEDLQFLRQRLNKKKKFDFYYKQKNQIGEVL